MGIRTGILRLARIVASYPPVDWTKSREVRNESNRIAREKSMIWPGAFRLSDEPYLGCGGCLLSLLLVLLFLMRV
jgi:hypothetical protein